METGERTKPKIKRSVLAAAAAVIVLFSGVVTLLGKWDDVYAACGLGEPLRSQLPFTVRVFSVGSADCILVQNGEHAMLIDSATPDLGDRLTERLHRLDISRLDLVVATHPHSDHIGGFPQILNSIPADRAIVTSARRPDSIDDQKMAAIFDDAGVPVVEARAGDCFAFGEGASVTVLSAGLQNENENDASVVLKIQYGDVSMLFMGDAEKETELELLSSGFALQADFIKLGHHGSKTSSCLDFLQAVKPDYAAVSCGETNPPPEQTFLHLDDLRVCAFRTDLDGEILFATDGDRCEFRSLNHAHERK